MTASQPKSAKGGTCTINSVALPIADWEFDAKADLPDSTDSSIGANEKAHVIGRREATFTLKGPLDFTTPQNVTLEAGTALTSVNLTTDGTKKYVIASASVESVRVSAPIAAGDPVSWEATCKSNGGWTAYA